MGTSDYLHAFRRSDPVFPDSKTATHSRTGPVTARGTAGRERFIPDCALVREQIMDKLINHQFRLAARPVGLPKRTDWSYTEEPVREPANGELLVKVLYISLDPAMRGWMNEGKSYIAPVGISDVMRAGGVGRVIASRNSTFSVGDHVYGGFGAQEYAITDGKGITRVDPSFAPLPVYLGTL